ncbi:Transposase IS4 [Popillia japonica]|uniref:Transposase IS4 n=1 Tax=Popillia japonica TaxID=7064 RepID=A0AAW1I9B1_POPJA
MDVNEGEHQVGEVDRGSRKRKRNMTSRRRKKEVSPATDVCGYCVRTLTQISICKEPREKQKLKTELQVHKVRAKNFHKLMKEQPADTTSCLCITENTDIKNPVFYTWLETEAKRGAAEVCSALRHFLETANFTATTKKLRLFADGCSGQNKNCHVMHMLMLWLNKDAPKMIQSIEVIFPVRGHSYLPADRVFGRAEKLIRAHSTIKTHCVYTELQFFLSPENFVKWTKCFLKVCSSTDLEPPTSTDVEEASTSRKVTKRNSITKKKEHPAKKSKSDSTSEDEDAFSIQDSGESDLVLSEASEDEMFEPLPDFQHQPSSSGSGGSSLDPGKIIEADKNIQNSIKPGNFVTFEKNVKSELEDEGENIDDPTYVPVTRANNNVVLSNRRNYSSSSDENSNSAAENEETVDLHSTSTFAWRTTTTKVAYPIPPWLDTLPEATGISVREMEQFIGIACFMSIYKLPRQRMFWGITARIGHIADVMSVNRWELIKKNVHLNDNSKQPARV